MYSRISMHSAFKYLIFTWKHSHKKYLRCKWVLLNRAPSSTQLYPHPPSSFQPPPSSFQPPSSSLQHPQQYLNQNIAHNWAISSNLGQKIKISILTENWHTWYIGGADCESRIRPLKFRAQNPFLGKFGPKYSKLSILSENWYTQYLKDADSESRLRFLKFWPQNSFLGKFGRKNSVVCFV